jgi:hypothetical protein
LLEIRLRQWSFRLLVVRRVARHVITSSIASPGGFGI